MARVSVWHVTRVNNYKQPVPRVSKFSSVFFTARTPVISISSTKCLVSFNSTIPTKTVNSFILSESSKSVRLLASSNFIKLFIFTLFSIVIS